ncbi:hypothetical protein [Thalassomonas actiniarum]|uniref:Uncharacterized protein n=1 Tax=Thalassomonas actiniarum TaxID=485447 RepID=A0AAE9YMA9_9GAMM|nr:hypothetical protein [Thalassomonas actiniarum]WDD97924.1 hypothetical protein SG35_021935 [Thalassomonas actiniarum]
MALDSKLFSQLQKNSSDSFHRQKSLIKKVMAGKKSICPVCGQTIALAQAKAGEKLTVSCKKGCTDIELDIEQ